MDRPVAVVTGGNRGLGLETCRQLGARGWRVLLTSRRELDGRRVAASLADEGLTVEWRPLDVADPESIATFAAALRAGGIAPAALVNNAGVYPERLDGPAARRTLDINLLGPLRLTEALAPSLARAGRVVMVSSQMGELAGLPPALRHRFAEPIDLEGLLGFEERFVEEAARGEHGANGALSYRMTKCGLNAATRLLAEALAPRGLRVNAVCPGWVRTAMGGAGAPRTPAEGAAGIVWAATLPPDGPTGGFFRDGHPIDW